MFNKVKELTHQRLKSFGSLLILALIVIGIFRGVPEAFLWSIPMRFTHDSYLFYPL